MDLSFSDKQAQKLTFVRVSWRSETEKLDSDTVLSVELKTNGTSITLPYATPLFFILQNPRLLQKWLYIQEGRRGNNEVGSGAPVDRDEHPRLGNGKTGVADWGDQYCLFALKP